MNETRDTRQKPLLIYDGACELCKTHVARLRRRSGDALDFVPYQEASGRIDSIDERELRHAVHLVEPDGRVTRAAEAIFRALAVGGRRRLLWMYRHVPGFARASEAGYRWAARHRRRLPIW
jgi:predicted DCC family thiol-disulfide oxidoreductase YuxK